MYHSRITHQQKHLKQTEGRIRFGVIVKVCLICTVHKIFSSSTAMSLRGSKFTARTDAHSQRQTQLHEIIIFVAMYRH